jgi:hypothetical protein
MAEEDDLDETDEAVWKFIRSYDFETYGWNTEEAAAELKLPAQKVLQSLNRIQRLKRGEIHVYYKEGKVHIQTA